MTVSFGACSVPRGGSSVYVVAELVLFCFDAYGADRESGAHIGRKVMKTRNTAKLTAVLVFLLLVVDALAAISTNNPFARVDVTVVEIESSAMTNLAAYGLVDYTTYSNKFMLVMFLSAIDMDSLEEKLNSIDIGANILTRMSSTMRYDTKTVLTAGGSIIHYMDPENDNLYKLKSVEGPVTRVTVTPSIDGERVLMNIELVRRELLETATSSETQHPRIGPPLINHQANSVAVSVYRGHTLVFIGKAASKEKDMQVLFLVTLHNDDNEIHPTAVRSKPPSAGGSQCSM